VHDGTIDTFEEGRMGELEYEPSTVADGRSEVTPPSGHAPKLVMPTDDNGANDRSTAIAALPASAATYDLAVLVHATSPAQGGLPKFQGASTSDFKVGATAPIFQVKVMDIIFVTSEFIVFLDEKVETYWWTIENYLGPRKEGFSSVLNRVAELESIPIDVLTPAQRRSFRTLVAEGVARALDEIDVASALSVHDKAERYVNARLSEVSRSWYLQVALAGAVVAGTIMALIAGLGEVGVIEGPIAATALAILGGTLGSAFSVLTRAGGMQLDPAAGQELHIYEAIARLLSGAIGGMIVTLAIASGQLIPMLKEANTATIVLLCIVAGVSERFVPSLISRLENTVAKSETKGAK
jgi:hypothetical protein